MLSNKKYVFLTGVPGSRWGRPENMIYEQADIIDISCRWPHQQDNPKHGTRHIYTFWGPFHEHGEQFDRLDLLGPGEVMRQIDAVYDDNDPRPYRIIRCHWFSYQLDWIAEHMPWIDILMVFREPEMSYRWWIQSGGWDISYPNYTWYSNDAVMKRQIMIEHKLMLKFCRDHGLKQERNLAEPNEWFAEYWPEVAQHFKGKFNNESARVLKRKKGDTEVLTPGDETLWPVLYRGRNNRDNIS
jgi:hypothetical protein